MPICLIYQALQKPVTSPEPDAAGNERNGRMIVSDAVVYILMMMMISSILKIIFQSKTMHTLPTDLMSFVYLQSQQQIHSPPIVL